MGKLEQHFHNILMHLLDVEATAGRIIQTRGMRNAEQDVEEGKRIKGQCKKIKEEVTKPH